MFFKYDTEIFSNFPELRTGVVFLTEIQNQNSPTALMEMYLDTQQAVLEELGARPLSELPALAAWRSVFRQFGVNPTKYRSSVEALLRRLTKKGEIPSINALVDICNMLSIRHKLPIAVFDVRAIQGGLRVHYSNGHEGFRPLSGQEIEKPEKGEVIFSDQKLNVMARRWCWRQSSVSAASLQTSNAIICTEAHHPEAAVEVEMAINNLGSLLADYTGGEMQTAFLSSTAVEVYFNN